MDANTLEILTLLQSRNLIAGLGSPPKRTPRCLYIDHCGKLWPLVPISANSSAVESPDVPRSPSASIKKLKNYIYISYKGTLTSQNQQLKEISKLNTPLIIFATQVYK